MFLLGRCAAPSALGLCIAQTPRSRAGLLTAGALRLVCIPNRSKHKVRNHFETSLEEAAVSRPGREAGMKNGQTVRAPKVRHRNHACHGFFTASPTRRGASERHRRAFTMISLPPTNREGRLIWRIRRTNGALISEDS